MYMEDYTPAAVTNEPKIHGILATGEVPNVPMHSKARFAPTAVRIHEYSPSETPVGCVSLMSEFLTKTQNSMIGDTHTKYCLRTSDKRANILRINLSCNTT